MTALDSTLDPAVIERYDNSPMVMAASMIAQRVRKPRRVEKRTNGNGQIRTFRAAQAYLESLVNYERIVLPHRARPAFNLAQTQRLLAALGNPHKRIKVAHIAGTKGKGSTATMLYHMLAANGLHVGLYTSPHLMDVRERIVVNGRMISENEFARVIGRVAEVAGKVLRGKQPTFFEALTVGAFAYFADKKVDLAILETGLGGRLDCTNVVPRPAVCALTSISMDHMSMLGHSLSAIAEEKAGIFKHGVPAISAPQTPEVKRTLRRIAERVGAPLRFAGDDIEFSYRFERSRANGPHTRVSISTSTSRFEHLAVPLPGEHQAINCGVALSMLDVLRSQGFRIDDEAAINGLASVHLPGRMEMICDSPRVLVDAAHNGASIDALMRAIGQNISYDSMVLIFGCASDKDLQGMLQHLQLGADKIIFTRIPSPRACEPQELAARFVELTGRMAQVEPNLEAAVHTVAKAVTREDLLCITGSFYLVGEAKRLFAQPGFAQQLRR